MDQLRDLSSSIAGIAMLNKKRCPMSSVADMEINKCETD